MTAEIVFYTDPMSRGRIVHWMLEESGAPYRVELTSLQRNEQKKPAYLAINPMGKVPAIVHNGTVITECAAICTYLAADVYIGSQIGFGLMMKALEPRPIFVKYNERLAQRDAFKRANEKGDKLSAQMSA